MNFFSFFTRQRNFFLQHFFSLKKKKIFLFKILLFIIILVIIIIILFSMLAWIGCVTMDEPSQFLFKVTPFANESFHVSLVWFLWPDVFPLYQVYKGWGEHLFIYLFVAQPWRCFVSDRTIESPLYAVAFFTYTTSMIKGNHSDRGASYVWEIERENENGQ